MALQIECPSCKRRCSVKSKTCKCGKNLAKLGGLNYWISYYDLNKKQVRLRIGPNKGAAEQALRTALSAKAEMRHIKKSVDAVTKFKDLSEWYLELPEVKAKRSYKRDKASLKQLNTYFGDKLLDKINTGMVEAYRQKRLCEISGTTRKTFVQPSSVNREVSCLRSMFNRGMRYGKCEKNPCKGLKMLKENNSRDRVLTAEEFAKLIDACPAHLQPIVKMAYFTGMRKGEITNLTWDQVDLRGGFIHLKATDTKNSEPRSIPLNQEILGILRALPQGLPRVKVFTYARRPVGLIRKAFESACKKAGIEDFRFHDLRHCFNTNAFLAGLPLPTIMAITGHKSYDMFKRYLTLKPQDLKQAMLKMENG